MGSLIVYHGNGQIDVEATAELAAQDGPDADDDPNDEQPATTAEVWGPAGDAGNAPGPLGRGTVPGVPCGPAAGHSAAALTGSDGGVGSGPQRPQDRVGHASPSPFPSRSPLGIE